MSVESHPVTVVIPHIPSRDEFLMKHCLPSIFRNRPQEIIILGGPGGPGAKRNKGMAKAANDYVFLCDDDEVVRDGVFEVLLEALKEHPKATFAYGQYLGVVHKEIDFPRGAGLNPSGPWDFERLKKGNYISTVSMFRKKLFPGFDEALPKLEDWDAWLTIAERGSYGVYVEQIIHESHHIDRGITQSVDSSFSFKRVKEKHGLLA
jgi:glycosyltransferase involved in cell wall biosynthesis